MRTIPLSRFRRRLVPLLDEIASSRQPLVLTRKGKPVAVIWKAYGPKKLAVKVNHLDFCLRLLSLEFAAKGIDLKAELFGPERQGEELKTPRQPSKPGSGGPG